MKRVTVGILTLVLLISFMTEYKSYGQDRRTGQISISGAFALYPMVVRWAGEYNKIYPEVRFDISAGGAGKGISDALNGMVDIGMVSREVYPEEVKKGAFALAVARDAVVAVVSEKNPVLQGILTAGLKKEVAGDIWITGKVTSWGAAFGNKSTLQMHVYTRSDACGAAEIWAKYLGMKQEDLLGIGVFGDPGLAQAVSRDPLGIGYNNMGYAYDAGTGKPLKGIRIVPIDLNGNGKVDSDEDFYGSSDKFIAAVKAGKYPSPPARELYFVTRGNPSAKKAVADFIGWVLSDGQKYVNEAGFIAIPAEKIETERKRLK